jgi:hypothetical protein
MEPTETRFELQWRGWRLGLFYNLLVLAFLAVVFIAFGEYWSIPILLVIWALVAIGYFGLLRSVFYVIIDDDHIHVRAWRTGANVKWSDFEPLEDHGKGELRLHYKLHRDDGSQASYSIYYSFWPRDPAAVIAAVEDKARSHHAHLRATLA